MAQRTNSTSHSVEEIKKVYEQDIARRKENFDKAEKGLKELQDLSRILTNRNINAYDKNTLRTYLTGNIGSYESNLRNAARYLFYRSNILFRWVHWYADMFCLDCRKVIPEYNLTKENDPTRMLKRYNDTLDFLDIMNMQNNAHEMLVNNFIEDVCYALYFYDDTGSFFYILDADECKIDGRYMTGDFSFAIDMSQWRGSLRQQYIEMLGEPLKSMWEEYQKNTRVKWVHVPAKYAACFKFRSEDYRTIIPPGITLLPQLANLNDLVDVQAIADEQQIYKLIYLPMKVLSGAKQSDDFEISPDLSLKYFDKLLNEALPDYVSAAPIPGDELGVIDFADNAASDVDRVEQSQSQILATAGGGAVLNANNITSTAAFNAWLKAETEFAISSLLPQIEGFTNRMLAINVSNPCKVEYFPISVYTKEEFRKSMLESCQYSFSNKLAYNTLLGMSEKTTIAMNYLEEQVLGLHELMKYPLSSSYTQSGNDVGRPETDDSELSQSGERSRNE